MSRPPLLAYLATFAIAYVGGSIPMVFWLGKRAGVDLRRYGSGNVGGHNLFTVAGPVPAMAGGSSDVVKGVLAVLVTRRLTADESLAGCALAGALVGQCWPLFLRGHGGRGVATTIGGMLALTPRAALWPLSTIAAVSAMRPLGHVTGLAPPNRSGRATPLGVLAGVVLWPLACAKREEPGASVVAAAVAATILLLRRLTARGWPANAPARAVLLNRLLLDRDERG